MKYNKRAKEILIRKLKRMGISKNAIKSQLRVRLTWNEDFEEKLEKRRNAKSKTPSMRCEEKQELPTESVNRENQTGSSIVTRVSKAKICKLCGKKILGDVLGHYSEKHFSFYVANRSVLESNPGAFSVSEDKYDRTKHLASTCVKLESKPRQNNKPETESKPSKEHTYNHRKMCRVIADLEDHPQEQTYRGTKEFECDGCERMCKHGRVIFVRAKKTLHLCYACYKHAKSCAKSKRGNKHVYINTPM